DRLVITFGIDAEVGGDERVVNGGPGRETVVDRAPHLAHSAGGGFEDVAEIALKMTLGVELHLVEENRPPRLAEPIGELLALAIAMQGVARVFLADLVSVVEELEQTPPRRVVAVFLAARAEPGAEVHGTSFSPGTGVSLPWKRSPSIRNRGVFGKA